MKAVRFYGIEDVRAEEIGMVAAEENEALIKVIYGGVCGSDLHIYRAGMFVEKIPETMGHEFVGEIAEAPVGSGFVKGDIVVGDPRVICGKCVGCEAGVSQCCAALGFIGEVRPGCFAEYVALPVEKLVKVAPKVDRKQAALSEPLAVALHAAARIQESKHRRALIAGGGPIGLLIAYILKHHYGFDEIAVADIDAFRRSVAQKAGIDTVVADVAAVAGNYPILVDVVGNGRVFGMLLENAVPRTEIYVSAVYEKVPEVDLNLVVGKELFIGGNNCYDFEDLKNAVALLESGKYDFGWLVTRVLTAEEAPEAFSLLTAREKKDLKILLQF